MQIENGALVKRKTTFAEKAEAAAAITPVMEEEETKTPAIQDPKSPPTATD